MVSSGEIRGASLLCDRLLSSTGGIVVGMARAESLGGLGLDASRVGYDSPESEATGSPRPGEVLVVSLRDCLCLGEFDC